MNHSNRKTIALNIRPSAQTLGEEGVTHINIDSGSESFGAKLSMRYQRRFTHIVYGNFASVDNFYFFIGCDPTLRDDRIRSCNLNLARNLNSAARAENNYYVLNQRALTMDAQYASIMTDRELVKEIGASTLKFDCYHTNENGYRIRHPYHSWFLEGMEEIRRAIIAGERPDFDFLCNDHEDLFAEARPYLKDMPTDPYEAHNLRRQERRAARIAAQEALASSEVRQRRPRRVRTPAEHVPPAEIHALPIASKLELPETGIPGQLLVTNDTGDVYAWNSETNVWDLRGGVGELLQKAAELNNGVEMQESEVPAISAEDLAQSTTTEVTPIEVQDASGWPAV